MCRICLKRPAIPDDRFSRCESCAKGKRAVYKFRLATLPTREYRIRAGELSPKALGKKLREQLQAYQGNLHAKPHLSLHEVEVVTANQDARLETIRISNDLKEHEQEVLIALRNATDRSDATW